MGTKTVDQLNNELLFSSFPKRIISLVPSISELLAHYEPYIQLVGVTRFCEYPKRLRTDKVIIGGTKDPDIKKILALKPDLIIANKEENNKVDIDQLNQSSPVWISDINTLDDASKMIKSLEELLGIPLERQIFLSLEQKLNKSLDNISGTVAYVIWQNPIMIAGHDTYISNWLKKIGLENISNKNRYPEVSFEWLNNNNPDYVFLSSEPYPFKEKNRLEFESLCKHSKIELVDGRMFSWYGKAMLEAPEYFSHLIRKLTA